jgi:hypothetical protein
MSSSFALRPFLIALLVTVGACTPAPTVKPVAPAPSYSVPPEIWLMVDQRIWSASEAAQGKATTFARDRMQRWTRLVRERTEKEFVPWYADYWTQQWLSIRMGWYRLTESSGDDAAAERLAEYLQEQYYERVLQPVAQEIDPIQLTDQAATLYVGAMDADLRSVPRDYDIPPPAFRERLEQIPAIAPDSTTQSGASLAQLLRADRLSDLPAYAALISHLQSAEQTGIASGQSRDRLYGISKRSADKLVNGLALRGGVSAAALAAGGLPGILISVGISGWQAMEHEKAKPALEAELRANLDQALDQTWRDLVEDPDRGVLAAVHAISAQIQAAVSASPFGQGPAQRQLPPLF